VQLVHVSDPGVQARVEVFRHQIAAARPATAMPSLVFGAWCQTPTTSCFSCGDPVGRSGGALLAVRAGGAGGRGGSAEGRDGTVRCSGVCVVGGPAYRRAHRKE